MRVAQARRKLRVPGYELVQGAADGRAVDLDGAGAADVGGDVAEPGRDGGGVQHGVLHGLDGLEAMAGEADDDLVVREELAPLGQRDRGAERDAAGRLGEAVGRLGEEPKRGDAFGAGEGASMPSGKGGALRRTGCRWARFSR